MCFAPYTGWSIIPLYATWPRLEEEQSEDHVVSEQTTSDNSDLHQPEYERRKDEEERRR